MHISHHSLLIELCAATMEPTQDPPRLRPDLLSITETDSLPPTRCPSREVSSSQSVSEQLLYDLRYRLRINTNLNSTPAQSQSLRSPITFVSNYTTAAPRSPSPELIPTRPHTPERMERLIEKWTTPGASASDEEDPTPTKEEVNNGCPRTPPNKYAMPIDRMPLTRARARRMRQMQPETRAMKKRRTLRPTQSKWEEETEDCKVPRTTLLERFR